ncbi:hypothetical protein ACNKHL_23760 [Shigella flexneri]
MSRRYDISATLDLCRRCGEISGTTKTTTLTTTRLSLRLAAQPEDHILAAANSFPTSICVANRSRYGPVNKALVKQTYITWQADCKENAGSKLLTGLSSTSLRFWRQVLPC